MALCFAFILYMGGGGCVWVISACCSLLVSHSRRQHIHYPTRQLLFSHLLYPLDKKCHFWLSAVLTGRRLLGLRFRKTSSNTCSARSASNVKSFVHTSWLYWWPPPPPPSFCCWYCVIFFSSIIIILLKDGFPLPDIVVLTWTSAALLIPLHFPTKFSSTAAGSIILSSSAASVKNDNKIC